MILPRQSLIAAVVAAMTVAALPALAQETKPAVSAAPTESAKPAEQSAETQLPEGKVLPDIPMGKADAPVTVIEYASFTCPHCAAFATENFPKLKAEYIDTGKVKFIQRDVYFDAPGLWAGILAHCGGSEKYYGVAEMLFSGQKEILSAKNGEEFAANLRKVGAKADMTPEQMDACWADKQMVSDLITTFQTNASADKIEGTPTFIINGETVQNQPWDELKKVLDTKVTEAEAKK